MADLPPGTIGQAKRDLERAANALDAALANRLGGHAWVSVDKAVVAQASAAIPVVPLYLSLLSLVMKMKNLDEGPLEQMRRLFIDFSARAGLRGSMKLAACAWTTARCERMCRPKWPRCGRRSRPKISARWPISQVSSASFTACSVSKWKVWTTNNPRKPICNGSRVDGRVLFREKKFRWAVKATVLPQDHG